MFEISFLTTKLKSSLKSRKDINKTLNFTLWLKKLRVENSNMSKYCESVLRLLLQAYLLIKLPANKKIKKETRTGHQQNRQTIQKIRIHVLFVFIEFHVFFACVFGDRNTF